MAGPKLTVASPTPRRDRGNAGHALVAQMLDHQAAQLEQITAGEMQSLGKVLQEARKSLAQDLGKLFGDKPGDWTWDKQQLGNALVMVNAALKRVRASDGKDGDAIDRGMDRALRGAGGAAGRLSAKHLNDQLGQFSEWFEGSIHPVQIQEAAVVAHGAKVLMPRYASSAARYSRQVQTDIRQQIAIGFLRNETIDQMTRRMVALGGPRGLVALRGIAGHPGARVEMISEGLFRRHYHWAERLVRTETNNAYNEVHDRGIEEAAKDDDEIARMWDAAADWRVCPICHDLDGTIAEVGKPFKGGIQRPPAHPNDRCTIVPWKAVWNAGHVGHPVQQTQSQANPTPVDPTRHDLYHVPADAPAPAAPALEARPPIAFPSANKGFREGAVFTVEPAAIAERVHALDAGIDRGVRLDKQRAALAAGAKIDPVRMVIDSVGTLEIIDGRHRWLAALEAGKPIEVNLSKARRINKDGLVNLGGPVGAHRGGME